MAEIYKTDYIEIKKIMAEKEIKTIKELAEKTGINRNTLSNILNRESAALVRRHGKARILSGDPARKGRPYFF